MTQNNLGTALQTLGERESGTARLEEAVAAYRAALEEGRASGFRSNGRRRRTISAMRSERSASGRAGRRGSRRRSRPIARRWRNGRASGFRSMGDDAEQSRRCAPTLGERESGTARLEEAVAAYRAALEEWTRERVPLDWAEDAAQSRRTAFAALAKRQESAALLEEALASMRGAVEVYQQAGEGYWLPIAQRRVAELEAELAEMQAQTNCNG